MQWSKEKLLRIIEENPDSKNMEEWLETVAIMEAEEREKDADTEESKPDDSQQQLDLRTPAETLEEALAAMPDKTPEEKSLIQKSY